MAYKRDRSRRKFFNDQKLYDEFFDKKNLKGFVQYASPNYREVTQEQKDGIPVHSFTWKTGDRFYKLAFEFYGKAEYWWVIALFNNTPTESHVKRGDIILVPLDYEAVIRLYGV